MMGEGDMGCSQQICLRFLIAYLKVLVFLPITACVQLTFYRLVHYFEVRRPLGSSAQANGDVYTPHVVAKQVALMSKASAHFLRPFNRAKGIFELITQRGGNVQVVNLDEKTCTCGKWEIFKYPCSHVLGACAKVSLNSWQYVDRCYSIVDYCATWASEFSPLPHEAYWPQSSSIVLLPNLEQLRNKKGRPRSTRLRNEMDTKEKKKTNLCGICRLSGHNRKRCPSKPRYVTNCERFIQLIGMIISLISLFFCFLQIKMGYRLKIFGRQWEHLLSLGFYC